MAIEYSCAGCHRALRVADDAAGRQARCPDCGTIQQVPWPTSPFRDAENVWFQPAAASPDPLAKQTAPDEVNPYQTPTLSPTASDLALRGPMPRHLIEARVQGPAIALIVLAVLMLVILGFGISMQVMMLVVEGGRLLQDLAMTLVGYSVSGLIYIVMLLGAIRMRRLRNYPLALTAGILALLPCSGCCIISLPCGIWALVVLLDANVRAAFE